STKEKAQQVLSRLNQSVPLETEALKDSEDQRTAAKNGDAGEFTEVQLSSAPALLAAVKELKPGGYTKSVVAVTTPAAAAPGSTAPAPGQTKYILAQLMASTPRRTPPLEEAKPMMQFGAIQKKD